MAGGDIEMQGLNSQLGDHPEGVFGNGTIDPSVFAPPAISSFSPVSSLSNKEEENIDQLDEEDVDAEGETDPDVVQSLELEPEPLPSK